MSQKPFDTVLEDLEFAVTGRNFQVTGRNAVGEAIAERHGRPCPRAMVLHVCNLEYARQFLEADPGYLLQMPCRITVHEQGGQVMVMVQSQLLAEEVAPLPELARRVNALLREMVDEAVR